MKKLTALAIAATFGLAMPAFAQNTTTTPVTGEVHADKQAVIKDSKTVHADKAALHEDLKARHEDAKTGDKEAVAKDTAEVKTDKATLKSDVKARHEAREKLHADRKERREEKKAQTTGTAQ